MVNTDSLAAEIAAHLLQIKAIKLSPQKPFTWASGIQSPIYCDNRVTLSYPTARTAIKAGFKQVIEAQFPGADKLAGVATGGIAHGALVADLMDMPFIYVRDKAKGHGMGNQIEGQYQAGDKVVVIEDLISTGGSSLKAVEALRAAGVEVIGLVAIFTYDFDKAKQNFADANCAYATLSSYPVAIEQAVESGYIQANEKDLLMDWYKAPDQWKQ